MKEIPLTQGKVAIVDDEDYDELSKHKWGYLNVGYASRYSHGGRALQAAVYMHVVIMGKVEGLEIDHVNGNKLDNRRENLRHLTHSQNMQNSIVKGGSSQYKGVCWDRSRSKWLASIYVYKKHVMLGRFTDEKDAARAYNIAALREYGEFARTNYIEEDNQ